MSKFKKKLIIFFIIIISITVLVILFISPITKFLVEKYDEKITGRQITMDWAYVNPFTGYIHFSDLKIFESKSDSVFFTASGLSANFSMLKIFSNTYEISNISLNRPRGFIIQNGKNFNFNDLIKKFSPKDTIRNKKGPVHFSILDIKIIDGEFFYLENLIPINYSIRKVNIESPGMRWDADTMAMKFSFLSDTGIGSIKGNLTLNIKNKDFRLATVIKKFDLKIIGQYLKDLSNFGNFTANMDADIKATGNLTDKEKLNTTGMIAISDFHLGKTKNDDYASFDRFVISIIQLNPKNRKYLFDSLSLNHPYLKYERYDHLDNIQNMFGAKGSNLAAANSNPAKFNLVIEIAKYVKVLSRNFFESNYKVNRLAIYKGDLKFSDFSISERFSMAINPFDIIADSIAKNKKRVQVSFKSGIKPFGYATINLSINPRDSGDFDLSYDLQKIPVSMFNPYIISYTSFPLDRGTLEFNGLWHVRNSMIQSNNHMLIIDPRVSGRLRNEDLKYIPLPLVFYFIRERGNVIDYEIPITGDLKNPKFHVRDILLDLFSNLFVKPATTAYRVKVRQLESEIEKSLILNWEMNSSELGSSQEKFIEKMAKFLENNPDATISVNPQYYSLKEKEYILFFEAKKKYYLAKRKRNGASLTEDDIDVINKMSVKDTFFVQYLNKHIKNPAMVFTIQEKCAKIIDSGTVLLKFKQLNKERVNKFTAFFKDKEVEKQLKINNSRSILPYNGFSFYKIEYKGEFPDPLLKAYSKMNDLNERRPRKRFKKERDKNRINLKGQKG